MASLWTLRWHDGFPVLLPAQKKVDTRKMLAICSNVPGATLRDGEVSGDLGALLACKELSGEAVNWGTKDIYVNGPEWMPGYQRWGATFTASKIQYGVMNNDDVGLGKTLQSLAAMSTLDPKAAKVVLCPAFLRQNWEWEIAKWWLKLSGREPRVQVLYPKTDRRSRRAPVKDAEFVVAFYLDAERAVDFLGYRSYYLIVDEIHNVKGIKGQRLESCQSLAKFSMGNLGLTASPLYNKPDALWSILDLVTPGGWGTWNQFARRYTNGEETEYGYKAGRELQHEVELNNRRNLHSFRRVREDVMDQLPFDTKYQTVWLEPPPGAMGSVKGAMDMKHGFAAHLQLVAEAKVQPVVEHVTSDGLPSLVFTWLREHATKISAAIPGSLLVLGGDGSSTRLARIADYVAKCTAMGRVPVVVGTLDALGEGANLQWAKVVNLASLDYTPDKIKQAVGRAARMGQTGTVVVRAFACRNTIDEHMIKVLTSKLAEQFKLDARKEKDKASLYDALSPTATVDALKSLYERIVREAKDT